MANISEALVFFLRQSPVGSLVGPRIYPTLIDPRVAFPAIGYKVESDDPVMHMLGEGGIAKASITLTCWADERPTAQAVADAVRNALSGLRGSMGSVFCRACTWSDFADVTYVDAGTPALFAAGKQTELTIWHTQSVPTPVGV